LTFYFRYVIISVLGGLMNIKKIVLITLVVLLSASLLSAAYYKKTVKQSPGLSFVKGNLYVTPQIGFNSWTLPFGANVEYAMTENIGIGGTVMAWFWGGGGLIVPSGEVAYHFTMLDVPKLDLSAGGGLGFAIATGGGYTGSIYPFILVNGRYFFSPKMAANLRFNMSFGDWGSAGALIGVTFIL
jgi:hypothetical protein